MKSKYKVPSFHATEFELDLAPLLSVMVKLVPVLLIASSFVQMAIVETELPQVVQEAIKNQDDQSHSISLRVASNREVTILIKEKGQISQISVPAASEAINYEKLNEQLTEVKKNHQSIFKVDLIPDNKVTYEELVKVMDASRKSNDRSVRFKLLDSKNNTETTTDYMFPEVVFANALEG